MKKTMKLLVVSALLGIFIPAWAQGNKTREVPNAPAFSAIEISGGDVNVYFTQGEGHSFTISGPSKLLKATKIKVKENTLFIEYDAPFFAGDDDEVTVRVSAPQLNRVTVSGKADFDCKTSFQGQELHIKTRQNGEVSMKNIAVNKVNIDAKGSSSVDLESVQIEQITVSALDRAEVELSGHTTQLEVLKKGMLAEIDTKKLITHSTGSKAEVVGQVAKDESIEFTFDD